MFGVYLDISVLKEHRKNPIIFRGGGFFFLLVMTLRTGETFRRSSVLKLIVEDNGDRKRCTIIITIWYPVKKERRPRVPNVLIHVHTYIPTTPG